ncbi:MAG: hypothetical protein ACLP6G_19070 [Terriglobales bacterium]
MQKLTNEQLLDAWKEAGLDKFGFPSSNSLNIWARYTLTQVVSALTITAKELIRQSHDAATLGRYVSMVLMARGDGKARKATV